MNRSLFNSLWLLLLAIVGFISVLSFSYLFLFAEDFSTSSIDESIEDQLASDQESWIKHVLLNEETNNVVNKKYGQFLYLEQYCNDTINSNTSSLKFSKLVFIIIDALRVDFVPTILDPLTNRSRMKFAEQILKTHGLGLQSVATIPTVTLARVKAILSGCLPSFMDYILNLNAYSFNSDNLVEQFYRQNKSIVFYGDDTWGKLFSPTMFHRMNLTSSLFAKDYVEVDSNVTWNVKQDLKRLNEWDVMMLHYLGVDHIGHLYGDQSDLLPSKFAEMDSVFKEIYNSIISLDESYLIVITGDHGMTKIGNHGGNTRDETHTALLFYSTNQSHIIPSNGTKFKFYDDLSLEERTILQIDIAPTVAALFNLPYPVKSQGRIISTVLERFNVPQSEHLCHLHQNAINVQHLIQRNAEKKKEEAKLKSMFMDALSYHYLHAHNRNDKPEEREYNYERSRTMYQKFISKVQRQYVKKATNRSIFSMLTFAIVVCYMTIGTLIYIEYNHNANSILFRKPFHFKHLFQLERWLPTIPCEDQVDYGNMASYFVHLRFFASLPARMLMLLFVITNLVFMGSTNFMEYEHLYWHTLASFILFFKLIITIRGYYSFSNCRWKSIVMVLQHYKNTIIRLGLAIFLLKLMIMWRIPLINEDDIEQWDFVSWLSKRESKRALSSIYIISLVGVGVFTSAKSSLGRPPGIFISALVCVLLYRSSIGSIASFKPFVPPILLRLILSHSNTYAQLVYFHVVLIVLYCFVLKMKDHFPIRNRTIRSLLIKWNHFVHSDKSTRSSSIDCSKFLHAFLLIWVFMSSLLLEAPNLPLFAANILLEKLIYFSFGSDPELPQLETNYLYKQMFYRLGTYTIFAFSSFYQIGNTNSLSTVNVNPCFIGLSSYLPIPCTMFMIISIYSTFVYWYIMFFVRLQQDLMPNLTKRDDESDSDEDARPRMETVKKPIILNYCTFYSIINLIIIQRLSIMAMNMTVTFILRDHLFIWSVICPKLLYEIIFTALSLKITVIMSIIFTHDNYFSLH